jgi:geranylgeranyl reductase
MKIAANILVIGGGPAGATAARFLAAHGTDVILLERNLSFDKPCGGGISLSAFDEYGIPKNIIKQEVKSINIISPKGEKLAIDLRGSNLSIIERSEFDAVLRKKAEEQGTKVIEGEFIRLVNDRKYLTEAIISGITYEISSEYIIAADGVNSMVRTALGIKPSRAFFTLSEKIKGVTSDCCEFWFGTAHAPYSYSWVFPSAGGISIGTGTLETGKIKTFFERFKEKTGILQEGQRRLYRIPIWEGDLYNKDKILFTGDAAGQVMPLTYEGIYYAMKAGEFAAKAIIENKIGNYKKMWRSRFQKKFIFMEKLRDYFLKNDAAAERLVALHKRPEIQDMSLKLWIAKDSGPEGLLTYIRLFGKILH